MVSAIAAVGEGNLVIGRENKLPWKRLPADMEHLRSVVGSHTIIVGSHTARSMMTYRSPLLQRCPVIVLTSGDDPSFTQAGFRIARSIDDALSLAERSGETEAFILGGAQIYTESLQRGVIHRLYLTLVHGTFEGDTFFPKLDAGWSEIERQDHPVDTMHAHPYSFVTLERKSSK
jgi:dihydrofolate reductase